MADSDEEALVSQSIHLELECVHQDMRALRQRITACEAKMVVAKSEINHIKNLMVDLEDRVDRLERRRKLKDTPV